MGRARPPLINGCSIHGSSYERGPSWPPTLLAMAFLSMRASSETKSKMSNGCGIRPFTRRTIYHRIDHDDRTSMGGGLRWLLPFIGSSYP